jgi:hypothetical protein
MISERPGWRRCASLLWALNHRAVKGRLHWEILEGHVDDIKGRVINMLVVTHRPTQRRIKARVANKIKELEDLMFKRAGENYGDELFFEELERYIRQLGNELSR